MDQPWRKYRGLAKMRLQALCLNRQKNDHLRRHSPRQNQYIDPSFDFYMNQVPIIFVFVFVNRSSARRKGDPAKNAIKPTRKTSGTARDVTKMTFWMTFYNRCSMRNAADRQALRSCMLFCPPGSLSNQVHYAYWLLFNWKIKWLVKKLIIFMELIEIGSKTIFSYSYTAGICRFRKPLQPKNMFL